MLKLMTPTRYLDPQAESAGTSAEEQIIKVDEGEDGIKEYKLSDLLKRYNTFKGKAGGFDEKAREAAELKKQAEAWQKQQDALSKVKSGQFDPDAFRQLTSSLGLPQDEVEAYIRQTETAQQGGGKQEENPTQPSGYGLSATEIKDLQELRRMMADFKKAGINPVEALRSTKEFADTANANWQKQAMHKWVLDNDPVFGKMIQDPEQGAAVFERLYSSVKGLESKGETFSPAAIKKVVDNERTLLAVFEKTLPAPASGVGPYSLGAVPSGSTFSRLSTPKQPDASKLNETGDVKGFLQQLAAFASHPQSK